MRSLPNKVECCGCKACQDACPQHGISMQVDAEGFWYPAVDKAACVDCGRCEGVCPVLPHRIPYDKGASPVCYAATNQSVEARFNAASGGVFAALADEMYRRGGYVGGAVYAEDWKVRHFISNHPDDLKRICGCKYPQSDAEGFYIRVKELLDHGEQVLVGGTPCQMEALRHFLGGKEPDNLIRVDFRCGGVASPKFFSAYVDDLERKEQSPLTDLRFEDKELGWRSHTTRYDFKSGKSYYSSAGKGDSFSKAYYGNAITRPSCTSCKFQGLPRKSDITLATFWGCEKIEKLNALDSKAGLSAVVLNTRKGMAYFESVKPYIQSVPCELAEIMQGMASMSHCASSPEDLSLRKKLKNVWTGLKRGLGYSQFHPLVFLRFLYYNLCCKAVHAHWSKEGLLYLTPSSVFEIGKGATLNLNGFIVLGKREIKKMRAETVLWIEGGGVLNVNGFFKISCGSQVEVLSGGTMNVDECGVNYGCQIFCKQQVDLLGHVIAGWNVTIRDDNAHLIAVDGYRISRPIRIEDHVWLSSGCMIGAGVKVRTGAVVGACSYVYHNVPAHCLVSGNPARVVEENIAWTE